MVDHIQEVWMPRTLKNNNSLLNFFVGCEAFSPVWSEGQVVQTHGADSDCQRGTVCRNSAISEGRQNVLERHRKYRSPRQVAQGVSNLDGHPVGSLR